MGKLFKKIFLVFLGFVSCVIIVEVTPFNAFQSSLPDKEEMNLYDIHSPWNSNQDKVVFVSNCGMGLSHSYFDFDRNQLIEEPNSEIARVANYVNEKYFEPNSTRFYSFIKTNFTVSDYIFMFEHALRVKELKLMVLSILNGALYFELATDLASWLEAIHILKLWKAKYPLLEEDIDLLISKMKELRPYNFAIERYGNDWEDKIDKRTLALKRYHPEDQDEVLYRNEFKYGSYKDRQEKFSFYENLKKASQIRDDFFYTYSRVAASFEANRYNSIKESLEKAAGFSEGLKGIPLVRVYEDFYDKNFEESKLWISLFTRIAEIEEKKIVFFFPPNLSFNKEFYDSIFFPKVTSFFKQLSNKKTSFVIDHSLRKYVSVGDLVPYYGGISGRKFFVGRMLGVLGKEKVSFHLIDDLVRLNLLQAKKKANIPDDLFLESETERLTYISAMDHVESGKEKYLDYFETLLSPAGKEALSRKGGKRKEFLEKEIWPSVKLKRANFIFGRVRRNYACPRNSYLKCMSK